VLAALERELEGKPFVAIGVHSPKFPNERDEEMVREAVRRYGVTHPVVIDSGHAIWNEYGVRGWPTLVLLDSNGYVAAAGSGEPSLDALREAVESLLPDPSNTVLPGALPLRPEPAAPGSLSFPGKVVWDGARVWIADAGHGQLVACDLAGNELERLDGFHHPNGIAHAGDDLYVADTGSHTIKRVRDGRVEPVAGTGAMARSLAPGEGTATEVPLRSPWDLAWDGQLLYVAMAGSHQIWVFDPEVDEVGPFAGTGHELRRDGPAAEAAFAQPSGLALLDGALYVADSEISSIRRVTLGLNPTVSTVCGSGDLFGFGDRDGVGDAVLLQHPIGVAAGDGVLYVADSFNHKVKRVDPRTRECSTLFGGLQRLPETGDGLWEPEGLTVAGDELLVADTNNHRVVVHDLDTGTRRTLLGG
jgi:DNA-binding beta-propeller fold protein YncE